MEFYVMPLFNKLLVEDVVASSDWYQSYLGFTSVYQFKDKNGNVMMDHLRLNKYQDLMLILGEHSQPSNGLIINLAVEELNVLAKKMPKQNIVAPIQRQQWNALEMTVTDFDGYYLTLTQPMLEDASFTTIMSAVAP